MKKLLILNCFIFSVLQGLGLTVNAQSEIKPPELTSVSLSAAYIPAGFDNNDKVQIVVEAWLPSSCYKAGPFQFNVDRGSKRIMVRQMMYKYSGTGCLDVITPFHSVIEVGVLPAGNYSVTDASSSRGLGVLPVHLTTSSNPDDALYAPVSDVNILAPAGSAVGVVLQGAFYKSCLRLKEVKAIQESPNVVTVLPLVEVIPNAPCRPAYIPFQVNVPMPRLGGGRYLLHVRSMSGQSLNKLFDIH